MTTKAAGAADLQQDLAETTGELEGGGNRPDPARAQHGLEARPRRARDIRREFRMRLAFAR